MNNRNIDFPVSSKRRKELEEALFRESMGVDEEDIFQQVMGSSKWKTVPSHGNHL